jgi:protein disulfide-isomerase A6
VFCYSQVKSLLRERLSGKASTGSNGKTSGGSSEKSEPSASVELNSRNFDELVVKSKDLWIVEFFAPWYAACCTRAAYHISWVIVHLLLSFFQME